MNEFKESIKSALNEYFEGLLKCLNGLTEPELYWQPSLESNHITWLVWHMARVEDRWINSIVGGKETVWDKNNWNEKFGVDQEDYGKGYNKEDISKMPKMEMEKLLTYYNEERVEIFKVIENLNSEDLKDSYPSPSRGKVTGKWILGHVIVEESQHLGQMAYIRGMMRGLNN